MTRASKIDEDTARPIASNVSKLAYSINDAVSISGLSRTFIYRAWRVGKGPKRIKAGKRTLISDESLRAWLRSLEYSEPPENS